ncbi:hypothetical protein O59_000074 [Cellvibrio sp. BR]|nr:hypothetical protein O59_000074 [Cellvibrio sp. BR]
MWIYRKWGRRLEERSDVRHKSAKVVFGRVRNGFDKWL